MNMKNFLSYHQWIRNCTGLELSIGAGKAVDCRLCAITLEADQLSILSKEGFLCDLALVPQKIKSSGPFAIAITGRGILVKKVPCMDILQPETLHDILPNLKMEEFYIQNFISGEYSFIGMIRRERVDELLKPFNDAGLDVISVCLGPFHSDHILTQLNCYGDEIQFDGHIIQTNKSNWSSYSYVPGAGATFPLKLGIEAMEEKFILAYAAAFQLLMYEKLLAIEIDHDPIKHSLSEHKEQRIFKFRSKALLGSFLILLLLNFLISGIYNSENKVLMEHMNNNSLSRGSVQLSEKIASQKEALLIRLGWNKGISYSYLCDQIGQTVPPSVRLNRIHVNPPLITASAKRKTDLFETGKIHIEGLSSDLNDINHWILRLKEFSWVRDAVLTSYAPADEDALNKMIIIITY